MTLLAFGRDARAAASGRDFFRVWGLEPVALVEEACLAGFFFTEKARRDWLEEPLIGVRGLVRERRSSERARPWRGHGTLGQLESLILAQNERWRQA